MTRHSIRHFIAALAVVGLAAGACTSDGAPTSASSTTAPTLPASSTTTTRPCGPGGRTIEMDGVEVREFCGPARAQVTVGDQTHAFEGGECTRHEEWLGVNLGVEVIEPEAGNEVADPRFRSFSLLMGRHPAAPEDAAAVGSDGTYQVGTMTFTVPGTSWLIDEKTITLVGTRTAGTVVGTALASPGSGELIDVEGVFTCDHGAIALDDVATLVEGEAANNE